MNIVLFAIWFFAPAGLANSAPVFAKKLPFLKRYSTPLDLGHSYKGKRIFGQNKTWRGLVFGIIIATLTLSLQKYLFDNFQWAENISQTVDYSQINVLVLGFLFGFGALIGDSLESFLKRRVNIKEGDSWFPYDQLDYIIGGLLASTLVIILTTEQYVAIIVTWFCLHLLANYIGFLLGIRESKI